MDRHIGEANMVRWQGRRLDAQTRAKTRVARVVLGMAVLSGFWLTVGFYSGLPIPIGMLQTAFVFLVAVTLVLGVWTVLESLMRRNQGAGFIHRRR
jgi:hypothetical protein